MWLISNKSMKLEYFVGPRGETPEYAILSHTWADEEVSFQRFTNLDDKARSLKGFGKIQQTCEMALRSGIRYSWIDTCCIDKTSSAELTESINSMFQYYRDAVVCYAWLADLPATNSSVASKADFAACRWFTRGWTLQELIAPTHVEFYDEAWTFRGTKSELSSIITEITSISVKVLRNPDSLMSLSVAQRMSWASNRQTTRVEDMAYCLLGIFDVSMSMLYGEGSKAFARLQEEIAKDTNDLSLLAWKVAPGGQKYYGILANSVADFRGCGSVENLDDTMFNPEFGLTNKGLRTSHELYRGDDGAYLMMLRCSRLVEGSKEPIGIWIQQHGGGVYGRIKGDEFGFPSEGEVAKLTPLYLAKRISPTRSASLEGSTSNAFKFRRGFNEINVPLYHPEFPFEAIQMNPGEEWDSLRRMFLTHGASEFTAYAYFMMRRDITWDETGINGGESFLIVFGVDRGESKPWVTLADARTGKDMFFHFNDLPKMAAIGRNLNLQRLNLKDDMMKDSKVLRIEVEEEYVDGTTMYCIDLFVDDIKSGVRDVGDVEPLGSLFE